MRRLFRKGQRVRNTKDGRVLEVLKYIRKNVVECAWFDLEKKEIRTMELEEDKLIKG